MAIRKAAAFLAFMGWDTTARSDGDQGRSLRRAPHVQAKYLDPIRWSYSRAAEPAKVRSDLSYQAAGA